MFFLGVFQVGSFNYIIVGEHVVIQYFQDPTFLRLLDESGGVPREIREMLEQLTLTYDPSSPCIEKGLAAGFEYLAERFEPIANNALVGLLPAVVLGEALRLSDKIPGSEVTYESMQHVGVVWLVPLENKLYHATMPLLFLQAICQFSSNFKVVAILNTLANTDWRKFELLCAHFSAYKMSCLSFAGHSRVAMSSFYGGGDMSPK